MAPSRETFWVGFDLGGTKMLAGVYTSKLKLLGVARKSTKANEGRRAGVRRLFETIREALAEAGVRPARVRGIGMGSPGPLDLNKGMIIEAPNLGWKRVPLRDLLEKEFHCPVVIANDVDAGLYGEVRRGAARDARCAIGVFPGTGIGGACVYQGRILRGRALSCMEIGHTKVAGADRLCGCGRRGCLETVAGRLGIASDAAVAVLRGEAPALARLAGSDPAQIRSRALAKAIRGGDRAIGIIVRHAARLTGLAVANAVNLLAPDVVVLGGGLVEDMEELWVREVERAANDQVMRSFAGTFDVRAAQLKGEAAMLGAAALAQTPDALT